MFLLYLIVLIQYVYGDYVVLFNGTQTVISQNISEFYQSKQSMFVLEEGGGFHSTSSGLLNFINTQLGGVVNVVLANDLGYSFIQSDGTVECYSEQSGFFCGSVVCDLNSTITYSDTKFLCRENNTDNYHIWGNGVGVVTHSNIDSIDLGVDDLYVVYARSGFRFLYNIQSGLVGVLNTSAFVTFSNPFSFTYNYNTNDLDVYNNSAYVRTFDSTIDYKVSDGYLVLSFLNSTAYVNGETYSHGVSNVYFNTSGGVELIYLRNNTVVGNGIEFNDVYSVVKCDGHHVLHATNNKTYVVKNNNWWSFDTTYQVNCLVITSSNTLWLPSNTTIAGVTEDNAVYELLYGMLIDTTSVFTGLDPMTPSASPSASPTTSPTYSPVVLTFAPSGSPTKFPSRSPTSPTGQPTVLTSAPTTSPSLDVDLGNSPGLIPTQEPFDPASVNNTPSKASVIIFMVIGVLMLVGTVGFIVLKS